MPKITLKDLRKEVETVLKKKNVDDAKKFFKAHFKNTDDELWGLVKPRNFEDKVFYAAIYRDVKNVGYSTLRDDCAEWLNVGNKTFQHNQREVRSILMKWGKSKIKRGNSLEWIKKARNQKFPKSVEDTNLFWDSADFGMAKKKGQGRKSPWWSHKQNTLGRRFMMICDCTKKIRYLDGPYSPKLFDGDWIKAKKKMLKKYYKGVVICGDTHFRRAISEHKNDNSFPKCYAPFVNNKKKTEDGTKKTVLTKQQQQHNSDISSIRGRAEMPFADFGKKFLCLKQKFREDEKELEKVVYIAAGFHNMSCK